LLRDADIMAEARGIAWQVLGEDPELENPIHRQMKDYVLKNAVSQHLSAG
jgi:hypothetical protein